MGYKRNNVNKREFRGSKLADTETPNNHDATKYVCMLHMCACMPIFEYIRQMKEVYICNETIRLKLGRVVKRFVANKHDSFVDKC